MRALVVLKRDEARPLGSIDRSQQQFRGLDLNRDLESALGWTMSLRKISEKQWQDLNTAEGVHVILEGKSRWAIDGYALTTNGIEKVLMLVDEKTARNLTAIFANQLNIDLAKDAFQSGQNFMIEEFKRTIEPTLQKFSSPIKREF